MVKLIANWKKNNIVAWSKIQDSRRLSRAAYEDNPVKAQG